MRSEKPGLDKLLADIKMEGKNEPNGGARGQRVIMGKMERRRKWEVRNAWGSCWHWEVRLDCWKWKTALYLRTLGLLTEIHVHRTCRAGFEPGDQEEASIRDPFLSKRRGKVYVWSSLAKVKLVAVMSRDDVARKILRGEKESNAKTYLKIPGESQQTRLQRPS